MAATLWFLAWWTGLTGLTLVLVSVPGPVEVAVAGAVAAGAAGLAHRMRHVAAVRPRGTEGLLRALVLLLPAALGGCAALTRALAGGAGRGELRRVRLREGADPGWAALLLGWSADTCVVDVPDGPDPDVVLHTLRCGRGGRGPLERVLVRRPEAEGER
ncbi:hypothetical protein OOK31_16250 [Streptomyces sp. NBC_00249]|uniref:hypothetical protein n=1 Tax=Streptomyces sp. NBC_00249 TaxID=2975690 RepID=UPI00224FEE01|nr:hypothetical protein [Streptomyces sp. NBC_00249]MCX5195436.1 hypothetical protein [Streptomyces sp. NBC_00249]